MNVAIGVVLARKRQSLRGTGASGIVLTLRLRGSTHASRLRVYARAAIPRIREGAIATHRRQLAGIGASEGHQMS